MATEKRLQELPGYYLGKSTRLYFQKSKSNMDCTDKETGKYFKIEAGTSHSSDIVKRRRLNDSKEDELRKLKLIRKPYIKRWQDPLLGGLFRRETGGRLSAVKAVAAGLEGPTIIYEDKTEPISQSCLPAFAWDSVTRGLFIPRNGYRMLCGCPESPPEIPFDGTFDSDSTTWRGRRPQPLYQHSNCRNLVYEDTQISTINVNESARLVCITRVDVFGPFGIVVGFLAKETAVPHDRDRVVADGKSKLSTLFNQWNDLLRKTRET